MSEKKEYKGLVGRKVRQMSKEETMAFLTLSLEGLDRIPEDAIKEVKGSLFYKIVESRLEIQGAKATDDVLVFLSTLKESSTPAVAVMWAYTIWAIYFKSEKKEPVTLEDLTWKFPNGFPIEDSLREAWDEQKITGPRENFESDNLLDRNWEETFVAQC